MDWTDRHCRFFHRLLSPNAQLYTEMVTTGALLHGNVERHLAGVLPNTVLQLGGSEPDDLAKCAKLGADWGYAEINLNCGCPSERVQKGAFGACLMRESALVRDCVAAMRDAVNIPVTIKCRIGVDDDDERTRLWEFVQTVASGGCDTFVIHARKAWLKGLSPKENREIPPLRYDLAAELKREFPKLTIILNGGIDSVEATQEHLKTFDGVMMGRAAYHSASILQDIERAIWGTEPLPLAQVLEAMTVYAEGQNAQYGTPLKTIARHMVGYAQGVPGARRFRQILSVDAHKGTPRDVFAAALAAIEP